MLQRCGGGHANEIFVGPCNRRQRAGEIALPAAGWGFGCGNTTLVVLFTVDACGRSSFLCGVQAKHVFTVGSFDTLLDVKVKHPEVFFPRILSYTTM